MVAALLLFLAASTPGSTSDFANRILSIEKRTGARIGVATLNTADGKRLTGKRLQNSLPEFRRCAARGIGFNCPS